MSNCNHYWFQAGHTSQWQCEHCEVEFELPSEKLQEFVSQQHRLSEMYKDMKAIPFQPPKLTGGPWYQPDTGTWLEWDGVKWIPVIPQPYQ